MKKIKDIMQIDLERYLDHLNKKKLSQLSIKTNFDSLKYLVKFLSSRGIRDFSIVTFNELTLFEEYLGQDGLSNGFIKPLTSNCKRFLRFIGLDHIFPKKVATPCDSPLLPALKDYSNYFSCERGYSKNGWEAYERDIKKFLNYMSANNLTSFDQIDQDNFTQFLKTLYHAGLEANSVRRTLAACKSFFRFLVREEIIRINTISSIEAPKIWQKQPDLLTTEEIVRVIEKPDVTIENGLRDRAILELLYGSGLRISELCNLKVIDFRFPEKMVRIANGKGGKERHIPLTGISIKFLQKYWQRYLPGIEMQNYAFVAQGSQKSLNRITIWSAIKKYVKQCGITKNVYPHSFRHCFATHMLENDAEIRVIQELMGHSNIATTGGYLQTSMKKVKEDFEKYHSRNEIFKIVEMTG